MWRPLELQTGCAYVRGSVSSCPALGLLCMGQLLQGSLGVNYGWQQYPVFMLWVLSVARRGRETAQLRVPGLDFPVGLAE